MSDKFGTKISDSIFEHDPTLKAYFDKIDAQIATEFPEGGRRIDVLHKIKEIAFYWLEGRVNDFDIVMTDEKIGCDTAHYFHIDCKTIDDKDVRHTLTFRYRTMWWDGGNFG